MGYYWIEQEEPPKPKICRTCVEQLTHLAVAKFVEKFGHRVELEVGLDLGNQIIQIASSNGDTIQCSFEELGITGC